MEALFLATRIAVRKEGKTPNGGSYNLLPTGANNTFVLTPEGQVLEFRIQKSPTTFLTYIYIGYELILDTDKPLLTDKKKYKFGQFGGFCLNTVYEQYKNFKLSLEKFLQSDNWFDNNFEYAQNSDSITIDRLEFNEPAKYYKQKKYFLTVTEPDMDFFSPEKYTDFVLDRSENLLPTPSGRFYQKNIPAIDSEPIKKQRYTKTITLIAFRADLICRDIFGIISKENISTIKQAVFKKYQQGDGSQYNSLLKIDQIIGELLKDWGYIDQVEPTYIFDGKSCEFAEAYYNSMSSFYSSLRGADKNTYFGYDSHNNPLDFNGRPITNDGIIQPGGAMGQATQQEKNKADNERRINILLKHLTTAGIGLLDYDTRLGFVADILNKPSLPKESGSELTQNNILKVISTFANPDDADPFLNYLLKKNNGNLLNFQNLYYKIIEYIIEIDIPVLGIPVGNKERSRKVLVYTLFTIWNYSKYNPSYIPAGVTPNSEGLNPNSFFLTTPGKYYFEKQNGEPATDKSLEFEAIEVGQDVIFNYYKVDEEFHQEKIRIRKYEGRIYNIQDKVTDLWYHLYQPIFIMGYQNVESDKKEKFCIPEFPRVPAFMFFYFKELEEKKNTNALINLGVQVTSDLLLMYLTGGASELLEVRYLKYLSESGKILLNPNLYKNATNVVRLWNIVNTSEQISFIASTFANFATYLSETSNNPKDQEFYERMRNLAFLVMLGTGFGSLIAQGKAVKEADVILGMLGLPEVTVILNDDAKKFLISLAQTEKYLDSIVDKISMTFVPSTGIDPAPLLNAVQALTKEQKIAFYFDFIHLGKEDLLKMGKVVNGEVIAVSNWKKLLAVGSSDRNTIAIITDISKTNLMERFYKEIPIKKILEASGYDRRWTFLNSFKNIDSATFNRIKLYPKSIYVFFNHNPEGQISLSQNANVWLKYFEARKLYKNQQWSEIAHLFHPSMNSPINASVTFNSLPGQKWINDGDIEFTEQIAHGISDIINNSNDVSAIAKYLNVSENIVSFAKENFFKKDRFLLVELPDETLKYSYGRFVKTTEDLLDWKNAVEGTLEDINSFKCFIAHEYIEGKLIDNYGMGYRSFDVFVDFQPFSFGAHDIAVRIDNGKYVPISRITDPPQLKSDLTNVDEIVKWFEEFYKLD